MTFDILFNAVVRSLLGHDKQSRIALAQLIIAIQAAQAEQISRMGVTLVLGDLRFDCRTCLLESQTSRMIAMRANKTQANKVLVHERTLHPLVKKLEMRIVQY